jgi:hypothetical protein
MAGSRGETASAPFFFLARAAWIIPYSIFWDAKSGEFHGVAGPRDFASHRHAAEASQVLNPMAR